MINQQKELQFHQQEESEEKEKEQWELEDIFIDKDSYEEIDVYSRLIIKATNTMNKTKQIEEKGVGKRVATDWKG